MSEDDELCVSIYVEDGVVVLHVSADGDEFSTPMTPGVAEEFADRMMAAARKARKQAPEEVQ